MALVDFYPSMQPSAAEVQNGKFFTLPIRPTKITQILSVLTHFIRPTIPGLLSLAYLRWATVPGLLSRAYSQSPTLTRLLLLSLGSGPWFMVSGFLSLGSSPWVTVAGLHSVCCLP